MNISPCLHYCNTSDDRDHVIICSNLVSRADSGARQGGNVRSIEQHPVIVYVRGFVVARRVGVERDVHNNITFKYTIYTMIEWTRTVRARNGADREKIRIKTTIILLLYV